MYRILLMVVALMATPLASAQEKPDKRRKPQFRVEVRIVFSNITARDTNNRVVTDLKESDFVVTDDGEPQEITYFEKETLPLRIMFMMDISRSMDFRIIEVRDSVWAIIDSLRAQDKAKVVLFDRQGRSHGNGFTNDKKMLKVFADSFGDGSDTRLYTALYVQIREITALDIKERRSQMMYRNVIIIFTDGEDTGSIHSDDEVLELARNSDIIIYTVHMPRLPSKNTRVKPKPKTSEQLTAERFLKRVADDTGGRMFVPITSDEVTEAYLNIAEEVATQYKIGYSPNVLPDSDSNFRIISITLSELALQRHPQGVYLRHRRGYTPK